MIKLLKTNSYNYYKKEFPQNTLWWLEALFLPQSLAAMGSNTGKYSYPHNTSYLHAA